MKPTKEQIEQEAARRYLNGSASYHAFIYGAEWVLNDKHDEIQSMLVQ